MNLNNNPALIDQLAASYALGTLRGGARRRFETLARDNAPLRAAALIWQSRLASVAELQPELAPSPAVWKRIENLVSADQQARAMQAARAASQAPVSAPASRWWSSLGWWRGATAAGAFATMIAVVTGLSLTQHLNSQVRELSAQLSQTPDIQYVAVLADGKATASMLVTFDPKNKKLVLKRVSSFQAQPGKSLELWALPPGAAPRSLGVLADQPVMQLTATESGLREVPMLAITLEPQGGVPPGSGPTGPLLFKGALLQTAK